MRFISIFFYFLFSQNLSAQFPLNPINKSNIDFSLRLTLFNEVPLDIVNYDSYDLSKTFQKFLSTKLNIDTLASDGFDFYWVFLEVSQDISSIDNEKNTTLLLPNKYIVAIDMYSYAIYRLSGFSQNDYPIFLEELRYSKFNEKIRKCKIEKLNLKRLRKAFRFFKLSKAKKRFPEFWQKEQKMHYSH